MDRKKKLNIVLVFFFILIWGAVIYKFFGTKEKINSFDYMASDVSMKMELNLKPKDTFQLRILKNPFQQNKSFLSKPKNDNLSSRFVNSPSNANSRNNISFPLIKYYGFVKNGINKNKLVLVEIGGRLFKLRESEEVDGVLIRNAYSDTLFVEKEKKVKKIIRFKKN